MQDFRTSIMAPIGEPINITGLNPIFARLEPFVRDLPIQVPPREFIEEPVNIGGITPSIRPLPAPVLPPSIPDPTPLQRLPIRSPRDEQIFVPPRTIVDRELPREILPPVTPPFVPPPQPPVAPPVAPFVPPPIAPPSPPVLQKAPVAPPIEQLFISRLDEPRDEFVPPAEPDPIDIPAPIPVASPVGINNNFATTPIVSGSAGPISVDTVGRTDVYGAGKRFDPVNLPDGYSFQDTSGNIRTQVGPPPGFVYAYGPDGDRISVPSGEPGAAEMRDRPSLQNLINTRSPVPLQIDPSGRDLSRELPPGFTPPNVAPPTSGIEPPALSIATPAPIPDPVIDPVPPAPTTPTAVATDVGADPVTPMPMGAIDPVLLQQATAETLTDPLIRSLYFGTADSPGFFQQLQQAGANLIGSDVPLQQTAGLTPLEVLARQQAVAGIGGFEPFLQQNRELVNQAIAQSRRAEQLQDPYYTQAEQIYQDTMGAYDPSMTQQFFNPFEDAVVQQTISDVLEAGEQQDIAARAREIGAGAFGGSRARLGAEERREALGEGLAQALGRIRQQGFSEAQRTGLGEFARQQQAKRTGAQGLIGIGTGRGSAAGNLAQRLAGFGGQMTDLGRTQEALRSGQRGELAGFGATGRGIAETGLSRIYEQQIGQQFRPLQTLGQIGSMLPGYQASQTKIDSQYGMPTDPSAAGLGAAFSAYGALAPRQGSS